MRSIVVLAVFALAGTAHADDRSRKIDWFAFHLDIGDGAAFHPTENIFLGRVQAGYVRVRGNLLSSIVAAVETKDLGDATYGIGGELVSVKNGAAVHAAVMTADATDVTFELGAGFAILRVEGQLRVGDASTSGALLGFIRLPFGAIAWKLLRD